MFWFEKKTNFKSPALYHIIKRKSDKWVPISLSITFNSTFHACNMIITCVPLTASSYPLCTLQNHIDFRNVTRNERKVCVTIPPRYIYVKSTRLAFPSV